MGKYLERAKELRNDPDVHYNCAQAVLAAFGPDAGPAIGSVSAVRFRKPWTTGGPGPPRRMAPLYVRKIII